jgi:hypothetical protein
MDLRTWAEEGKKRKEGRGRKERREEGKRDKW